MKRYLEQGFTLVELMVVVAIIGILSAVAIPNFKKYQAKSKTTEAKMQLASIYSYELTAAADYDSFSSCLGELGYSAAPKGYYMIGFNFAFGGVTVSNNGLPGCVTKATIGFGSTYFSPTGANNLKSYASTVQLADLQSTNGTQSTFTASAAGNLDTNQVDRWYITETKNLVQFNVGY